MTASRSPRRVGRLTLAGSLLLLLAGALWGRSAWTNWWLAGVRDRPERSLDSPLEVVPGARSTARFTPNAGIPHLLFVEFEAGLAGPAEGPCPVAIEWIVRVADRNLAAGDGAEHRWRTGDPGMGIVWLGRFDADRGEEHVVEARVLRGPPGAVARLQTTWDHQALKNARILALLLSRLAWAPFGLGTVLVLLAWFRRSFSIRRRS